MVIFKCIVIVCDLQVVRKNSDYIWKEQTKLHLAPLFVSHFVFLYEYILIGSKHFTFEKLSGVWETGSVARAMDQIAIAVRALRPGAVILWFLHLADSDWASVAKGIIVL